LKGAPFQRALQARGQLLFFRVSRSLHLVNEVIEARALLTSSPFGDGILRRLFPRVLLTKLVLAARQSIHGREDAYRDSHHYVDLRERGVFLS